MPTKTDLPATAPAPRPDATWRDLAGTDHPSLRRIAADLMATPLAPIDPAIVSPAGFDTLEDDGGRSTRRAMARIVTDVDGRMRVVGDDGTVVASFTGGPALSAPDVAALRPYAGVVVPAAAGSGPRSLATLVAQLLVAGVPVTAPQLPISVGHLLGDDLADMVRSLDMTVLHDIERRERWSVHARRRALLRATTAGGADSSPPVVTAVLTDDESPGVERLVRQLQAQSWPDVEIVRVPARGDAVRRALETCSTPLATVATPGLQYGPDHITDLVLARGYSRRPVVGVRVRRRYLEALDVTVCLPGGPTERPPAQLTAGALLGAPADLLARRVADADPHDPVDLGEDGYAGHDLGVAVEIPRADLDGRDAALLAASRQRPGHPWREPRLGPDPAYRSYFARSGSRSA